VGASQLEPAAVVADSSARAATTGPRNFQDPLVGPSGLPVRSSGATKHRTQRATGRVAAHTAPEWAPGAGKGCPPGPPGRTTAGTIRGGAVDRELDDLEQSGSRQTTTLSPTPNATLTTRPTIRHRRCVPLNGMQAVLGSSGENCARVGTRQGVGTGGAGGADTSGRPGSSRGIQGLRVTLLMATHDPGEPTTSVAKRTPAAVTPRPSPGPAVRRRLRRPSAPITLAGRRDSILEAQGRSTEAESLFREAIVHFEPAAGPEPVRGGGVRGHPSGVVGLPERPAKAEVANRCASMSPPSSSIAMTHL